MFGKKKNIKASFGTLNRSPALTSAVEPAISAVEPQVHQSVQPQVHQSAPAIDLETSETHPGLNVAFDPAPLDPASLDPAQLDPAPLDPASLDSAPLDPAPLDPAPLDPAPLDPASLDSASLDPMPLDHTPLDPMPLDHTPLDPLPLDHTPLDQQSENSSIKLTSLQDETVSEGEITSGLIHEATGVQSSAFRTEGASSNLLQTGSLQTAQQQPSPQQIGEMNAIADSSLDAPVDDFLDSQPTDRRTAQLAEVKRDLNASSDDSESSQTSSGSNNIEAPTIVISARKEIDELIAEELEKSKADSPERKFCEQALDQSRRFQSIAVEIAGDLLTSDGHEQHCKLLSASPGTLFIETDEELQRGQMVVLYLAELGRIQCMVLLTPSPDIAFLTFDASPARRDKLAAALTFIGNRDELGITEDRLEQRITPRDAICSIKSGSKILRGRIVDFSLGGAGVIVPVSPEVGSEIKIGKARAQVIRHFDGGVGVSFIDPHTAIEHLEAILTDRTS